MQNCSENPPAKTAKLEKSSQNLPPYKLFMMRDIKREQLGELIPMDMDESIKEPVKAPTPKTDNIRYCTYCGKPCEYKPKFRKYTINCIKCNNTPYLPPKYCNICGARSNSLLISYLDNCCDPKVTGSDCLDYSEKHPYN